MGIALLLLIQISAVSLAISVARRIEAPGKAMLVGNLIGVGILVLGMLLLLMLSSFAVLFSMQTLPEALQTR